MLSRPQCSRILARTVYPDISPRGIARYWPADYRLCLISQSVRRAGNTSATFVQNVGIDHCGTYIIVPQELLHRPDIISSLQEMSGKGMPKRVRIAWRTWSSNLGFGALEREEMVGATSIFRSALPIG